MDRSLHQTEAGRQRRRAATVGGMTMARKTRVSIEAIRNTSRATAYRVGDVVTVQPPPRGGLNPLALSAKIVGFADAESGDELVLFESVDDTSFWGSPPEWITS